MTFADEWMKQVNSDDSKDDLVCDHLKDLTVVSKDGAKIKCHRLILSIRSEVFKAMLEPAKNTGSTINITEFDGSTIRKMIRFMYTDVVPEDGSEIDMDLLAIANKYQIKSLKSICERKLCEELDVNNTLDAWIGANLFDCNNLLASCENFLSKYWLDVQETESFERLRKENCEGMCKLTVKMLNLNAKSKRK